MNQHSAASKAATMRTVLTVFTSSPSARVSTSAEESHPLNSPALLATILNDVFTFGIGLAFLNLHCFFAYDAVQETYERAFIVVQMMSRATHLPLLLQPDLDQLTDGHSTAQTIPSIAHARRPIDLLAWNVIACRRATSGQRDGPAIPR
jgi:hypothetical protein